MSEAAFHSRIGALATSAGALAAFGAALRLRRDGATAPVAPAVLARVRDTLIPGGWVVCGMKTMPLRRDF